MDEQTDRSELRLALALRGGVSLAVWIGGACAEIDQLRRAPDTERGGRWTSTLGLSGHDRVVVDVLAGASAGGLNGVLYSASQIYDFDFRQIRDIWVEVGSTSNLRRTHGPWPSLFDGDGYFLREVQARLADLIGRSAGQTESDRRPTIDLRLSATTVEPLLRPVPSPSDEQLVERRHGSGFHFRQHAENWLGTDFPDRDDGEHDAAIARLALAARATSSFPGAFEAAAVRSGRPRSFVDEAPEAPSPGHLDSSRVFLDRRHRVEDGPDADLIPVADGGILDNIPIARALDAVAEAPASGPTRRALVYLHPGVPTPTESAERRSAEQRRSTLAVAQGFVAARIGSETIERDIAEIEEHNRSVRQARILRTTGIGAVDGPEQLLRPLGSDDDEERSAYVEARIGPDADLIARLLLDPIGTLGSDRFPRTVGGITIPDEVWRSPVGSWPAGRREEAYDDLLGRIRGQLGGIAGFAPDARMLLARDALAIRRVTLLLLEWTLLLGAAGLAEAATGKERLYRVLTFVQHAIEEPRRLAWTSSFAAVEARRAQLRRSSLLDAPEGAGRRALERRLAEQARRERAAIVNTAANHIDGLYLVDPGLAERLRGALLDGAADGPDDPRREAHRVAHHAIEDCCRKVLSSLDALAPIEELLEDLERIGGPIDDGAASVPEDAPKPPPADERSDLRALLLDQILVPTLVELASAVATDHREDGGLRARLADVVRDDPTAANTAALHQAIMGTGPDAPAWLAEPADDDERGATGILVALEIIGFGEMSTSRTSRRPVEFVRLSAGNRTPVAPAFEALAAEADARGLRWDPDAAGGARRGIHVDLKLAGNELANFAAFLDGEWRHNDWMWGRLDAVPTLVDLLVRPDQLLANFDDAVTLQAAIEAAVSSEALPWLAEHVLRDRRAAIGADCRAVFDHQDDAGVSISAIRDALVTARQWEILAEELGEDLDDLTSASLLEAVARHDVGARGVRDLDQARLVGEVEGMAHVARQTALWNAEARAGDAPGRLVRTGSAVVVRVGLMVWRLRRRFGRQRGTASRPTTSPTIDLSSEPVDLRDTEDTAASDSSMPPTAPRGR